MTPFPSFKVERFGRVFLAAFISKTSFSLALSRATLTSQINRGGGGDGGGVREGKSPI